MSQRRRDIPTAVLPQLYVTFPWGGLLASGVKTVEGRAGPLSKFSPWVGNCIRIHGGGVAFNAVVVAVRHYATIEEYLEFEGWSRVAPHLADHADALKVYRNFYSDEHVKQKGGMNAIQIQRMNATPSDAGAALQ